VSFHFDEQGLSIHFGFSAEDIAGVPAGRPGVVGMFAPRGPCYGYIAATSDTKGTLYELLVGDPVPGLLAYLALHGGLQFVVEETADGEARAQQLIDLYRPLFNEIRVAASCARDAQRLVPERRLTFRKERLH
jgi:hypothetical protein